MSDAFSTLLGYSRNRVGFDLGFLRLTEFFPPRPTGLAEARTICVATKSRNLGDALALTTLPEKLRQRFPQLEITTHPRGFNPVVFAGNPHVSRTRRWPRAVYGDDINWDRGQLIQLKELFFELPITQPPRPRLYLSDGERHWARDFIAAHTLPGREGQPIVILHPWGTTRQKVAEVAFWDELVRRHPSIRFWQVGLEGQLAVQGCEYYLLLPPGRWQARKLFAIVEAAQGFVGIDSGPMHVARALQSAASLIFVGHAEGHSTAEIFRQRREQAWFLGGNPRFSVLYEENRHITLGPQAGGFAKAEAIEEADAYLKSF